MPHFQNKKFHNSPRDNSKLSEDASSPILLNYNDDGLNNLLNWTKRIIPHIKSNFGEIGKILENEKEINLEIPSATKYTE